MVKSKRNVKKKRWTKVVAVFVIIAFVFGVIAAGLFVALTGTPAVAGTYTAPDGTTLVLAKDGTATIRQSSPGRLVATANYKVEGNSVTIRDPKAPGQQVSFGIDGKNLVAPDGAVWVRK